MVLTVFVVVYVVLTSRRFHSRDMLGLVDWQLLVLFGGLFVVNGALADTELVGRGVEALAERGVAVRHPAWLFGLSVGFVGSIANIIVVEQARLAGVRLDWRVHARIGVPVTLLTLALAAVALAVS